MSTETEQERQIKELRVSAGIFAFALMVSLIANCVQAAMCGGR